MVGVRNPHCWGPPGFIATPDFFAKERGLDTVARSRLAFANAVKHGNRCDCDKHVRIKYRVTPRRADVVVEDEGPGFNPSSLPDPTLDQHIESTHGRGILLMQAFMNNVVFSPSGNSVTLTKFNDSPRGNAEYSIAFG
jgi:anti-sigma regulatory factor (Ser/Thr protein kinase)